MRAALLLAAVVLTLAGVARAGDTVQDFMVGNDLLRYCRSHADIWRGQCIGYIEGVSATYEQARAERDDPPCIPLAVKAGQVRDVVIRYLEQHPEIRHQTAASQVVAAIKGAWGCE